MDTQETDKPDFDGEKVKMSKVEKFFESQRKKFHETIEGRAKQLGDEINKHFKAHREALDGFINGANVQIQKMDKKFSNMYGILVNKFLTQLENRVYTNELSNKAMMLMLGEKLYALEAEKAHRESLPLPTKEDYLKQLELDFVQLMTNVHTENEKAIAEEAAKEVKNEEAPKETVEEVVATEEAAPADVGPEDGRAEPGDGQGDSQLGVLP